MANVFDVANYFLAIVNNNNEYGDVISNLKLQKLCYYAQGLYLAINNEPLFKDEIEAWQHGPVVPSLYCKYKDCGNCLTLDKGVSLDALSKETKDFLDRVYAVYGQFSAWKLREMTHNETPWKSVYTSEKKHIVITKDSMKKFFKSRIS